MLWAILIGGTALAVLTWFLLRPKQSIGPWLPNQITVVCRPGAVMPWAGLEEALATIYECWPKEVRFPSVQLWILPYGSKEIGTDGFLTINGVLCRPSGITQLAEEGYIVAVIQLRSGGSPGSWLAASCTGPMLDAGKSALFHEICGHVFLSCKYGDMNAADAGPLFKEGQQLKEKMASVYQTRMKGR